MIAIKNAKIVLENSIMDNATLLIEKGRISAYGNDIRIPENCEVYDAQGCYVGPGFVDIHVHGGNGHMFYENPAATAEHFLGHGTTTMLAALYYDLDKNEFLNAIDKVKTAMKEDTCKAIAGFYMEGPYMNPKYGASKEKNKWKGAIKREDYEEILQSTKTLAKVWVVAPEREGVEEFVKDAKKINPDAVISVGHSEATPAEIMALKKYKLILETHCMNATGKPEPDFVGTKTCGPDEACLTDKDMYAELICDSQGIHVPADLIRMVFSIKGADKIILISDSFAGKEKTPENLSYITDLQFDSNGDLCGSKLTLDKACANIIKHTGCSINDAFNMASRNPARILGMDNEIGTIEKGKTANLVIVDENFCVKKVIRQGEFVKKGR